MQPFKRWERDDDYIQIVMGMSANGKGEVLIVESNAFKELPVKCRAQVPLTDKNAVDELVGSVSRWAESEGFQLVSVTAGTA